MCTEVSVVQWCLFHSPPFLSLPFTLHHSFPSTFFLFLLFLIVNIILFLQFLSSRSLFLDLEDKQAQVDVLGSQEFVALHRIGDG